MLERVAAWFLNTYVAEYVGNVLKDQLSIGLLRGAVELEKLPLKKDALKKLKLPVNVKSGYIGKLKLQIPPVRYIKSQPWVVQIDQLYIIVGPPQPGDYDASEEEEQVQAKKQAKLDKLEEEWKAEQQRSSSWWFKWLPVTTFFPSNVIANLQDSCYTNGTKEPPLLAAEQCIETAVAPMEQRSHHYLQLTQYIGPFKKA